MNHKVIHITEDSRNLAIFLCGIPGAGKETLGTALVKCFPGIRRYVSGDELRKVGCVTGPGLSSDDQALGLLRTKLTSWVSELARGHALTVLVDGVPRNLMQTVILSELHRAGWDLGVLHLGISDGLADQRMAERASRNPARTDEGDSTFRKRRIDTFNQEWGNIFTWLRDNRHVRFGSIDASGSADDVLRRATSMLPVLASNHFRLDVQPSLRRGQTFSVAWTTPGAPLPV